MGAAETGFALANGASCMFLVVLAAALRSVSIGYLLKMVRHPSAVMAQ